MNLALGMGRAGRWKRTASPPPSCIPGPDPTLTCFPSACQEVGSSPECWGLSRAGAKAGVPSMPRPRKKPRKKKSASRQAGQTPSPEPPAEAVSRSPTNSRKFSQRVKKKRSNERGSKPGGQHHGTSPELSEPDPQASTPQILPEEQEVTVQPGPRAQEQQHGKSETGAFPGQADVFPRAPYLVNPPLLHPPHAHCVSCDPQHGQP